MKRDYLAYIIPALLALGITVGIVWYTPLLKEEHLLEVVDSETGPPEDYSYYYDLDGDGNSEILTIFYNSSDNLAVSVARINFATINQFNMPGRLTKIGATLDLHDIDSNGIVDLFFCTEKNDSLFLTIIDDLFGHPTTTRVFFLDLINRYNDNGDYLFTPGGISDLNGDGWPEYVMAINGGYSLQPRRVYAIDYKNDTVIKSPQSGAAVASLDLFDIDGDGFDEVLLHTVAPENFKTTIPYRDSVSWLMVLDQDLTFYRPPLPMKEPPSSVSVEPFVHEGQIYMMVYHRFREGEDYQSYTAIYDSAFREIRSKLTQGREQSGQYMFRIPGGTNLGDIKFIENTGIFTYDFDLNYVDSVFNDTHFGYNAEVQLDADADGEMEYFFMGVEKLQVFRSDFNQSSAMEIHIESRNPRTLISLIEEGDAYPMLSVQLDEKRITVLYKKNIWFKYRALVYPGIYFLLFALLYLLVILQNRIISRRYEKDRLISQLQLQTIKNQLDPHFTYNALNAVGSLIYKGEKELAYQYLKGFSDLLRMVSSDASQVTWTIFGELEFLHRYLEIEKLRFREKFIYTVKMDDERLNDFMIPKLSILTFVENAIKHGLRHKEYERKLDVEVSPFKSGIKISIRDNGIGRAAAARIGEENSGKGIKMMKQYFKQFNVATGKKAQFKVTDLFEYDLKASGTLVEITIV